MTRCQKPTLWKAFVFISIFDRFSVDATGENASNIILFNTDAGNCCRDLSQWAHDSSRPDDVNVAPQRNLQHVPRYSPLYICDTDAGSRWRLRYPVAVDVASCLSTQIKRTQVNSEQTQRGVREQQQERRSIFHLVISVSILDNLGCFIKLPLLTICK